MTAMMRPARKADRQPAWLTARATRKPTKSVTHAHCDCERPLVTTAIRSADGSRWCARCLRPIANRAA